MPLKYQYNLNYRSMNNTIIMNYFLVYANYSANKPHSVKMTPFSSTRLFYIFSEFESCFFFVLAWKYPAIINILTVKWINGLFLKLVYWTAWILSLFWSELLFWFHWDYTSLHQLGSGSPDNVTEHIWSRNSGGSFSPLRIY